MMFSTEKKPSVSLFCSSFNMTIWQNCRYCSHCLQLIRASSSWSSSGVFSHLFTCKGSWLVIKSTDISGFENGWLKRWMMWVSSCRAKVRNAWCTLWCHWAKVASSWLEINICSSDMRVVLLYTSPQSKGEWHINGPAERKESVARNNLLIFCIFTARQTNKTYKRTNYILITILILQRTPWHMANSEKNGRVTRNKLSNLTQAQLGK